MSFVERSFSATEVSIWGNRGRGVPAGIFHRHKGFG